MKENEINLIIKQEKSKENIDTKKISDTHHTFGELYEHRIVLFAALCNKYSDLSWKSKKHYDEKNDPMYKDSFIAGINTPLGIATYHIKLKYYDIFKVKELKHAPEFDGYSEKEVLKRILSLK